MNMLMYYLTNHSFYNMDSATLYVFMLMPLTLNMKSGQNL